MTPVDDSRTAQDSVRDQLLAAARREPDPARTAQTALRDALTAAAVREYGAEAAVRRRRRKRRGRVTGLIVIGLLGAAGVAQGTGLISSGESLGPAPGKEQLDKRFANAVPGGGRLVMTADDPDSKLNWGVAVYTSVKGEDCVIAGQVRGNRLGLERNGVFRPYSDQRAGGCVDLARVPQHLDLMRVGGRHPRTLVYGLTARADERISIRMRSDGEVRSLQPAQGGAFLFVLDGSPSISDFEVFTG